MKTQIVPVSNHLLRLVLVLATACLFVARPARAGLTMSLEMSHELAPIYFATNYQILLYGFDPDNNSPAAPSGNYTVSSPTGALVEGFDLSSAGTSNFTGYADSTYSDYNSFINELTNGNWTITISNGTTTVYSFKISAPGFTSNTLPNVNVTYPPQGSTITSNNPTFTWQGISWSSGDIQAEDYSGANFFVENFLPFTATSWTSPSNLPAGANTFLVTYVSPTLSTITTSTPTNGLGQTIGSWTFQPFIADYTVDGFTVSNAPAVLTLATALNTTNLTWTTSGASNWFAETNVSYDGVAAAQSGRITGSQISVLQTTVTGPGTLTFWWQTSEPTGDIDLEFDLDGDYVDDIGGTYPWNQEPTVTIPSGTHTLTWTATGFGAAAATDAAWVDQVQFTSNSGTGPVTVQMSLSIQRAGNPDGSTTYYANPYISEITPIPITTNSMVSPDGTMYSQVWAGDSSNDQDIQGAYSSLDQAIDACTNGLWTLYINQGDPSQRVYYFSMSINSLTTNLLSPVTILSPALNAINVASNSPLAWSGPTNASYLFAEAYQEFPDFAFDGTTNLDSGVTNWPSPPALLTGTNYFYVQYGFFDFTNFVFTTPVDASLNPIASWEPYMYLYTSASSIFTVKNPLAVQLSPTPPQTGGGNFQLSFQTIPGHTEIVQMRTNLTSGTWTTVTNFTGDGSTFQLSTPITNSPGKYYRVITQ